MTFPHPETGELLDSQADFMRALADIEEQIQERAGSLYRQRRAIREEAAERFDVKLPRARDRTPTQEKVARCPRCNGRLDAESD